MIPAGPSIGTITSYTMTTASRQPTGIAAGPDGNLWFVEVAANKIGRITTTGAITEFSVPTASGVSTRASVAVGPDGNLWFSEYTGNKIGRITPSGTITEFTIPTPASAPLGIVAGPDGAIWFAETATNKIGRLVP
jgi:virginiamycin B lyase